MTQERQWTQDELAVHLRKIGWTEEEVASSGNIPQGIKRIVAPQPPLTDDDMARAKEFDSAASRVEQGMSDNRVLDPFVPVDPLMAEPWISAFSVAMLNKDIIADFEEQTGLSWNPPRSPIDKMVDEATGYREWVIVAFAKWFNDNIWGDPRMDHTGRIIPVEQGGRCQTIDRS